jgi:hypothetical protein
MFGFKNLNRQLVQKKYNFMHEIILKLLKQLTKGIFNFAAVTKALAPN